MIATPARRRGEAGRVTQEGEVTEKKATAKKMMEAFIVRWCGTLLDPDYARSRIEGNAIIEAADDWGDAKGFARGTMFSRVMGGDEDRAIAAKVRDVIENGNEAESEWCQGLIDTVAAEMEAKDG